MAFHLSSTAFSDRGDIPVKFTCDGSDVSPALSWNEAPQGVKSFALIVDDPDAPSGTFTHWILYAIPGNTQQLPEGVPTDEQTKFGQQGRNGFGRSGYGGPCPPPGRPHRYFFKMYALNSELDLKAGATRKDLENAMKGHVIAHTELVGRYQRK